MRSLEANAPDASALATAMGYDTPELGSVVYDRVSEKLSREPIEDYRIDFEDGYGVRPAVEEDDHATSAAKEVAAAFAAGALSWRVGIRVKSFDANERERSVRTLRRFLASLMHDAGRLPPNFVVTLPKVSNAREVTDFVQTLAACEHEFGLDDGALRFEVMIETPQIVLGADGRSPLPSLIEAGGARLQGAIFGAYDFTAALGITAAHQSLRHPSCDFARQMMLVGFAGSHVQLSDGATAVIPVAVHPETDRGALSATEQEENRRSVHAAWKLHYDNIRHALASGFYQGWDLHPAQLVSRYAATFAFFIEGLDAAGVRLRNFIAKSAQATRVGAAFDDAATGRGLVNYFRLAVSSGAVTESEAIERSGMSAGQLLHD